MNSHHTDPLQSRLGLMTRGFTLLEVLIALVIIAIALTAIIKTTTESIHGNIYLREKTIATWVALNAIHQTRAGLIQLPEAPGKREENAHMLNQTWQWQGFTQKSDNSCIRELHVQVFHQPEHRFMTELVGYVDA